MHGDALVDGGEDVGNRVAELVHTGVAGDHGVHVDGRDTTELLAEAVLEVIDDIVKLENVAFRGNLRVKGDDAAAGAVVMHHQVVNAEDCGVKGKHQLLDAVHVLLLRRLPEKRVDDLLRGADARKENEAAHKDTCVTVDLPAEDVGENRAKQNHRRGDAVA